MIACVFDIGVRVHVILFLRCFTETGNNNIPFVNKLVGLSVLLTTDTIKILMLNESHECGDILWVDNLRVGAM